MTIFPYQNTAGADKYSERNVQKRGTEPRTGHTRVRYLFFCGVVCLLVMAQAVLFLSAQSVEAAFAGTSAGEGRIFFSVQAGLPDSFAPLYASAEGGQGAVSRKGEGTRLAEDVERTGVPGPDCGPVPEGWWHLIARLEADGFARDSVRSLFSRVDGGYSVGPMGKKMRELFRVRYAPPTPPKLRETPKSTAPRVYASVMVKENLDSARRFLREHATLLRAMERRYGIPKEVAVGLLLVETRLGGFLGHEAAFRNLACLAATDTMDRLRPALDGLDLTPERNAWLEKRLGQKASWAYAELKALITYAEQNGLDPVGLPGSLYGAVGLCQFMPSSILRFGVDANGDGVVDLFDLPDALFSMANYLKAHGWKPGLSRTRQHRVLRHYNNSTVYANTILAVADHLR